MRKIGVENNQKWKFKKKMNRKSKMKNKKYQGCQHALNVSICVCLFHSLLLFLLLNSASSLFHFLSYYLYPSIVLAVSSTELNQFSSQFRRGNYSRALICWVYNGAFIVACTMEKAQIRGQIKRNLSVWLGNSVNVCMRMCVCVCVCVCACIKKNIVFTRLRKPPPQP